MVVVVTESSQSLPLFRPSLLIGCDRCVCTWSCVGEQFVVAKNGIETQSDGGDAEALANVDEAVVLEVDGVRDSTAHPLALP